MKMNKLWIMAALSACMLAGCGSQASAASTETEKTADGIAQSILSAYTTDMEEQDEDTVIKLLGLEEDTVKEAAGYTGKTQTEDMILVVISDTNDDASIVNDSMNYYLDTLENSAQMYQPAQLEKIKNTYIATNGNISLMALGDDMAAIKKAAASAMR